MPAMFLRFGILAVLVIFGLRYFLLSLKPHLFKIDYFKLDERREAAINKLENMKAKAGLKLRPKKAEAANGLVQTVREDGTLVHFEYNGIKVSYEKDAGLSNIFMVVSLFPELHAKNRFAEGLVGMITLKEASRLKRKYPDILSPRGFRGHIDDADVEKYYLIYPPTKALSLKAQLKEGLRELFNSPERIHMQFKGQLLKYKTGSVNGKPVSNPIKANVLYLQQVQLIHAYNTENYTGEEELTMESTLM